MSTRVMLIPGTNAWRPDVANYSDWYIPGSPFIQFLTSLGIQPIVDVLSLAPFTWSTEIGGVPLLGGLADDRRVWHAAGINLFTLLVPPLCPGARVPGAQTNLIAHSHGGQVALYAAAEGLKVNTLITVSTPVREDMADIIVKARPNIKHWLHLHSDSSDRIQWYGSLFDRHVGIEREFDAADENVMIPGVGHSGLLNDAGTFRFWTDRKWLDRCVCIDEPVAPATT